MELRKFYHVDTNDVVYVVIGAESKSKALKFVSQYKKFKYATMVLTHKVVNAKIVGEDLYVGNNDALNELHGVTCYAVARKNVAL